MLAAANKSHLVTLTKDKYIGIGSSRIKRRGVMKMSLSEHYLQKSAFDVGDARILDNICQQRPRPDRKVFHYEKETPQLSQQEAPRPIEIHTGYSTILKEVKQIVKR